MKHIRTYLPLLPFLFAPLLLFGQFSPNQEIVENRNPEVLSIADLDGDGDNDVLAGFTSSSDETLGWYENVDGTGTFGILKPLESNINGAAFLETADFDGDGILDLFVFAYKLSWLKGLGNGEYAPGIVSNVNSSANKAFVMDIDGDGDIDIAYVNSSTLYWLENDGLGNFSSVNILLENLPYSIQEMVDIDGDADADLLTYEQNAASWYENDGGNFDVIHDIATDFSDIYAMTVSDFDDDGDPDFALAGTGSNDFVWFENTDGLGAFTNTHMVYDIIGNYGRIWNADMDGDLDKDIIMVMGPDYDLVWLENLNNSTAFGPPSLMIDLVNTFSEHWFGDFDGDNDIDQLAISETNSANIYWTPNEDGLGNFGEKKDISKYITSHFIAPSDVDGDGDTDLLIASGGVAWMENLDGLGDFSSPVCVEENSSTNDPYRVFSIDVDGDNDNDLLAAWAANGHRWYENLDGAGNFGPPVFINTNTSEYTFLDDVDGDGDKDLISIHSQPHEIRWTELEGGAFTTVHVISQDVGTYTDAQFEDFDNDGDKDLIVIQSWQENALYLYRNNNGNFGSKILIDDPEEEYRNIAFADLDNDGWNDLVSNRFLNNYTLVWQKSLDGNGTFDAPQIIHDQPMVGYTYMMLIADMDGNGYQDLLTVSQENDAVNMYANDNGVFGTQQLITTVEDWYRSVSLGDINGNGGDKDLIHSAILESQISWQDNYYNAFLIQGTAFWDENENEVMDPTEPALLTQQVLLDPQEIASWSDANGQYRFVVSPGNYTLSIQPEDNWEAVGSPSANILITNQSETHHFALKPGSSITQASMDISSGPTRCDQPVPFWLSCKNNGTTIAQGTLTLQLDDAVAFQSASPAPDQINGNLLTWNFNNLIPTHSTDVELVLTMPDAGSIGDTITLLANTTLLDDIGSLLFEGDYDYASELTCAYDPNEKLVDKSILHFPQYEMNGGDLVYTIRFQNTGNDTAFHVRLEDQLDANLNGNSFQPITASHPYKVYLRSTGLLTFDFNNIMLPDSNVNEPASHGFVKFHIAMKDNLTEGTFIENEASIFFDQNPPILTNTATTVLETIVSAPDDLEVNTGFKIWPNPSHGNTQVSFDLTSLDSWTLSVTSALGQHLQHITAADLTPGTKVLELSSLENGIYLVTLHLHKRVFVRKLIVVNRN